MPKFHALDFELKRGHAHQLGDKGLPIFATEADYFALAEVSEIIPGKLYLSDVKSGVEWVQEIIVNSAAHAVFVNIGCNYADFGVSNVAKERLLSDGRLWLMDLPDGGRINPFAKNDFDTLYEFIDSNINQGKQVLIHCASGASRSPTIVIAYLMRKYGLPFETALYHVGACRPLAEPSSFKQHLEAYEKELAIPVLSKDMPLGDRLNAYEYRLGIKTLSGFLKRHQVKLLAIGLSILILAILMAFAIALPPALLTGFVGVGILGSGGVIANILLLGSLNALSLFAVISGSLLVITEALFSLATLLTYAINKQSVATSKPQVDPVKLDDTDEKANLFPAQKIGTQVLQDQPGCCSFIFDCFRSRKAILSPTDKSAERLSMRPKP